MNKIMYIEFIDFQIALIGLSNKTWGWVCHVYYEYVGTYTMLGNLCQTILKTREELRDWTYLNFIWCNDHWICIPNGHSGWINIVMVILTMESHLKNHIPKDPVWISVFCCMSWAHGFKMQCQLQNQRNSFIG